MVLKTFLTNFIWLLHPQSYDPQPRDLGLKSCPNSEKLHINFAGRRQEVPITYRQKPIRKLAKADSEVGKSRFGSWQKPMVFRRHDFIHFLNIKELWQI
jgi:hypothetical protein